MNPAAQKAMNALVEAFIESVRPPSDDEMVDTPELTADQRAVLMHAIYDELSDIASDIISEDIEDDGSDDDEYASVRSDVELARGNKGMSQFYKSFMGGMKNGTEPWHKDREEFLRFWAELGNQTVAKSPAPEGETQFKLVVVDAGDDSTDASEVEAEDADLEVASEVEIAGGLPTSLLQAFTDFKFVRNNANQHAITYELYGKDLAEGYRLEVSRDMVDAAGSYTITLLGKVNNERAMGIPVRTRQLSSSATTEEIIRVITKFKTLAAQHVVV